MGDKVSVEVPVLRKELFLANEQTKQNNKTPSPCLLTHGKNGLIFLDSVSSVPV